MQIFPSANWLSGFDNMLLTKDKELIALESNKLYRSSIEKVKKEMKQIEHYKAVMNKLKLQENVNHTTLKTELFTEFKNTNINLYDCLKMASHNASLIRSSFYTLTEAAKLELAEFVKYKEREGRVKKYWADFLEKTLNLEKEIIIRVIIVKGSGRSKNAINQENGIIHADTQSNMYINSLDSMQKRPPVSIGNKKLIRDPDLEDCFMIGSQKRK